ncbi:MAG: YdcF family protein [Acidimicrobiales bacterium]
MTFHWLPPGRRRRRVAIGAAASLTGWAAATAVLFVMRDDADRPLAPADAVVVLAGGRSERLDHGLRLAASGAAPVLVISNGDEPDWPEARAICRGGPGLPTGVEVLCPRPDPQRTAGEATMVARLAAERGWRRVVVVTSDFHALRSRLWFERCAAGAFEVEVVGVDSRYDLAQVWGRALREQVGLLAAVTVQRGCPAPRQ